MSAAPSPVAHLHPSFRDILERPVRERLAFMDHPRWIEYRTARIVIDTLKRLIEMPSQPRMRNLLVIGDPNNGKTTLATHFRDGEGKGYVNEEGQSVKPVVIARIPAERRREGALRLHPRAVLGPVPRHGPRGAAALPDHPHAPRVPHADARHRRDPLAAHRHRAQAARRWMNALKMLCNELQIPIVGVGTKDAVQVLHTDDQHKSRFDVVALPVWKQDEEFQRLLAGFEQVLPLKRPSNLAHPDVAIPLQTVSGGNIGNLHRLLVECARDAITSGAEQIDRRTVEKFEWMKPTRGIRTLEARRPRWTLAVGLLADESLSSWLVRASLTHGCEPSMLTDWLWPGARIWTTDVDRGVSAEQLQSGCRRIRNRRRSDQRRIARHARGADRRRITAPTRALALGTDARGARGETIRGQPVLPGLPRRGQETPTSGSSGGSHGTPHASTTRQGFTIAAPSARVR